MSEAAFFVFTVNKYSLPLAEARANSIMLLSHLPHEMTILQACILSELCKLFIFAAFAFAMLALTYLARNRMVAVVIGACYILLPKLLELSCGVLSARYFALVGVMLTAATNLIILTSANWNRG